MAAEGLDPKTFSSWEEAFQHPIPTVRGLEKQLRRDIESNKGRLHSLVGASYRDLLGTAETIIQMNDQMHNVETLVSEIGQKCNTRLLEKKHVNLRTWRKEASGADSARYAFASQLSVLRSCPDVISSLLKSGGSVLLAAKVLVLSRLLHTKLSKRPNPPPYLETLRNRLATLRRKLLTRVDRHFKALESSKESLIETMCAFALATSSSPTDVVRHFHHLRLEAMSESMGKGKQDRTLHALRLYIGTMSDTQALVPGQLARSLEMLKDVSIFKSHDLYSLMELDLDIHERWIGDDIRTFTPYIRHDELSKAEADRSMKQWARLAEKKFLEGLRERIQDSHDPVHLMELRKEVLVLWLNQHQSLLRGHSAEILDGLRDVFNDQCIKIIQERASSLEQVGESVRKISREWRVGETDITLSLWDESLTSMEITHGAKKFCDTIADRLVGRNEPLRKVTVLYTQWLGGISAIETTIKSLRESRWEDNVEDLDEDEDVLENKQILLSEDDPRLLQTELAEAVAAAYTHLQSALEPSSLSPDNTLLPQQAVFVLRVWREIRQNLASGHQNAQLGADSIYTLFSTIVDAAIVKPLKACSKRLKKSARARSLPTRPLWEGDPELPVLPSPWAHRLLFEIVQSMIELGTDIWSPRLAERLRAKLGLELYRLLTEAVSIKPSRAPLSSGKTVDGHVNGDSNDAITEERNEDAKDDAADEGSKGDRLEQSSSAVNGNHPPTTNGTNTSAADTQKIHDISIQRLFDILYITHATATTTVIESDPNNGLPSVQRALEEDLDLQPRELERLRGSAADNWNRTKLLFALLG